MLQRFARADAADRLGNVPDGGARQRDAGIVRGDRHLGVIPEGAVRRQRFLAENVERRPGELPAVERIEDIGLDLMPAAPRVDQIRALRQLSEQVPVEDASVSGVSGSRQTRISLRARKGSRPSAP